MIKNRIKSKSPVGATAGLLKPQKESIYLIPLLGFRIWKCKAFVKHFQLVPSQRGNVSAKRRNNAILWDQSPPLLAGFAHYRDSVCLNQTGGRSENGRDFPCRFFSRDFVFNKRTKQIKTPPFDFRNRLQKHGLFTIMDSDWLRTKTVEKKGCKEVATVIFQRKGFFCGECFGQ